MMDHQKDGEMQVDGNQQGAGALLAPWTKSINALNLESTMAVPRKDRKPLPSLAPKAMAVRVAQMPPPPKTPKVEKRNDSTPVSTLNPQAKAFQPGKAGVLHLAVSPGGSLSGTVKEGDHSHERGGFMGFGPGAMQEGPGGFHPQQRGNQRDSQKEKRSFSPKELLDDRTMHQVCSQLLDQVAKSGDQDKDTNWPEANGVAIHAIFGQPTITQDQLNQWLVRHANRASGQGGPAMGGPGGPQGQPGPPQQQPMGQHPGQQQQPGPPQGVGQ